MNTLAIECSSAQGSMALFIDGQLAGERTWLSGRGRSEQALEVLPDMMSAASLTLDQLDLYAVGRGPGNYSGMRVALTIAQALALPGHTPVHAVSSGDALAYEAAMGQAEVPVAVVGDARRQRYWYAIFDPGADAPVRRGDWALAPSEALADLLTGETVVVSPEWERLEPNLESLGLQGLNWVRENRYPSACAVGTLVLKRLEQGGAPEPVSPLYMHKAV